jgi:hypothetical protein
MAYINQIIYQLYQPIFMQKIHCYEVLNLFWKLFENRQCSFREIEFQPLTSLAFGKAEIQFLENYTGDFQITLKKDSKFHNNVFSAIKKVGHRGYLSAKAAFLVDIGHIDGDVMLSW